LNSFNHRVIVSKLKPGKIEGNPMGLVKEYGEIWARNDINIKSIPGSKEGGQGVYVLYDGSMPVYIGKGNMRRRRAPGQHGDH
jgi:hypothetical protein